MLAQYKRSIECKLNQNRCVLALIDDIRCFDRGCQKVTDFFGNLKRRQNTSIEVTKGYRQLTDSAETLARFLEPSTAPSAARAFRAITATGEEEAALVSMSSVRESSPA